MEKVNEFLSKGPAIHGVEWISEKIKSGMTDILADYITVIPILIGVSIPVYALLNMISKSLAKLGVVTVFIYGWLVVVF